MVFYTMQTKSSEDSDGVWWLGQDGAAELTSLITTSSSFLSFLCPARQCRPPGGGEGRERGGSRPNSNESVLSRVWPGTEVLLLLLSDTQQQYHRTLASPSQECHTAGQEASEQPGGRESGGQWREVSWGLRGSS